MCKALLFEISNIKWAKIEENRLWDRLNCFSPLISRHYPHRKPWSSKRENKRKPRQKQIFKMPTNLSVQNGQPPRQQAYTNARKIQRANSFCTLFGAQNELQLAYASLRYISYTNSTKYRPASDTRCPQDKFQEQTSLLRFGRRKWACHFEGKSVA